MFIGGKPNGSGKQDCCDTDQRLACTFNKHMLTENTLVALQVCMVASSTAALRFLIPSLVIFQGY